MIKKTSGFLIAAPSSGSGKTMVTLGLLKALVKRGLFVQPFKCGPDYIDTQYHNLASGNESVNLDVFLSSREHVQHLYSKYGANVDVCVTEGVMGLFDGFDRMKGSSADMAGLLDIPVILVINAKSMAYSVAPILYGFKNFNTSVNVAGVIFNFVGSESHYRFLKEACEDVGLESLGYLPKQANLAVPSRHLGLSLDKEFCFEEFADEASLLVEKYINIDRLLDITAKYPQKNDVEFESESQNSTSLNIAIAKDEAFNFTYRENIDCLKKIGRITYFSPLDDAVLPDADIVYLPGGYPELFLSRLSENKSMQQAIRKYVEGNGKLLAECGGMMYLCSSIEDSSGTKFPMVGIFDQVASMKDMKLKLGYRAFEYNGQSINGHEFHYSSVRDNSQALSVARIYNAKGIEVDTKLWRYKNTLAGYTHIYWAEIDFLKLFD